MMDIGNHGTHRGDREDGGAEPRGPGLRRALGDLIKPDDVAWRIGVSLLVAVIVPFVINQITGKVPVYASVLLATTWFTASAAAEVAIVVNRLHKQRERSEQLWDTHDALDALMANMRKSLRTLVGYEPSDQSLFRSHFHRRLSDLDHELSHSAQTRSLEVVSSHLERASLVLNEFAGRPDDVICAVHSASDNAEFVDHLVQEWFQRIYDLARSGRVAEVRRLILIDSEDDMNDPMTQMLINFHMSNDRYDCRIMDKVLFMKSISDFTLALQSSDFALYAGRYAFVGKPVVNDDRRGFWYHDPEIISSMRALFDNGWRQPVTKTMPRRTSIRPVSPDRLFRFARERYGRPESSTTTGATSQRQAELSSPRTQGWWRRWRGRSRPRWS